MEAIKRKYNINNIMLVDDHHKYTMVIIPTSIKKKKESMSGVDV